jgi:hypothetical protein
MSEEEEEEEQLNGRVVGIEPTFLDSQSSTKPLSYTRHCSL